MFIYTAVKSDVFAELLQNLTVRVTVRSAVVW